MAITLESIRGLEEQARSEIMTNDKLFGVAAGYPVLGIMWGASRGCAYASPERPRGRITT